MPIGTNKRPQGLSQRAYAKHAGVALSYVQKLVARGAIPTNQDGTINARVADAYRALNTNVRRAVGPSNVVRTCTGCGDSYRWAPESPDPARFCCSECCQMVAAGMSTKEIRQKIAREARA